MNNISNANKGRGKVIDEITTKVPGPVESFDAEEPWDWPTWPWGR
jgi:hypothetical protein